MTTKYIQQKHSLARISDLVINHIQPGNFVKETDLTLPLFADYADSKKIEQDTDSVHQVEIVEAPTAITLSYIVLNGQKIMADLGFEFEFISEMQRDIKKAREEGLDDFDYMNLFVEANDAGVLDT